MTGTAMARRGEAGSALLLAIVLAAILGALAAVMALTSRTETLIAGRFHQGQAARYAADGGLARAMMDLSSAAEWNSALSGVPSSFADGDPAGAGSLTADVQRAGNAGRSWGTDTPQWRLYAWGPASAWLPAGEPPSAFQVAVWIADDPADGDGDPAADANATVSLFGVALGPGGIRRAVRALVARPIGADGTPGDRGIRLLSWHETRW